MSKQMFLTEQGLNALEKELENLKTVRRKEISERIKVALSFGDLSENSEYDEAKNEQAIVESRILEIENVLKNVRIIDESELSTDSVHVGSLVEIYDYENDENLKFRIVGTSEADPVNRKISDESPIGHALLSHKVGDEVVANTPNGPAKFRIAKISK